MKADNHSRQISEGHLASLRAANIGASFHERQLGELGEVGERIAAWAKAEAKDHFKAGRSVYIRGKGALALDALMLTARALHLLGIGTYVTTPMGLLSAIRAEDETVADRAEAVKVLTIQRFYSPADAADMPVTPYHRALLEDFLLSRLQEGKPLLLGGTIPLGSSAMWWRPDFLDEVTRGLHLIEV